MNNNNQYAFTIEKEYEGIRLDAAISSFFEEISRNSIQKMIEEGQVFVDGETCKIKKQKVKVGSKILLTIPEPKEIEAIAQDIPINIIYEDSDLLVLNKDKNMVVHPASGNEDGTLVNAILFHCKDLSSINGKIRPGIVHRIDKDTTGLLVVAKNDVTHNGLASQFAEHSITRAYHAIVYNNFTENEGTIDLPLGRDPKNRLKRAVTNLNSKKAVTHYRVIERFGKFTYLELKLETGRTHQIRAHLSHINHPILGDPLYGPKKAIMGLKSQLLHAKILGFIHPTTKEYLEFTSDLPKEFVKILDQLQP